jgi:exodeoxyribonuclease VII large subunit
MAMVILKVSQLNRYVRSQLTGDPRLSEVYVRGELSGLTANQRSGHLYFTLKDEDASLRAVMYASNAEHLTFMPQNGLAVIARGAAGFYERDGSFHLAVSELMLDGAGALGRAFEQLKQRLAAEGLFDAAKKRPIPQNPAVIGLATSESGAALQDILSVLRRRCPTVLVLVAPAAVQGRQAAQSIARAVARLNEDGRSEVIIVGRGGGSPEDLWAFNEEAVVRAVAGSAIPVISAVGHESDVTLCDLAADLRAATPTAAAELAVPDLTALRQRLFQERRRLRRAAMQALERQEDRLAGHRSALSPEKIQFFLNKNGQRLNLLIKSLYRLSRADMERLEGQLKTRAALLDTLSPLRVLSRGYSITEKNGRPIASAGQVSPGDPIITRLADGWIASAVERAVQGETHEL